VFVRREFQVPRRSAAAFRRAFAKREALQLAFPGENERQWWKVYDVRESERSTTVCVARRIPPEQR
jgi:hypothetical protein